MLKRESQERITVNQAGESRGSCTEGVPEEVRRAPPELREEPLPVRLPIRAFPIELHKGPG